MRQLKGQSSSRTPYYPQHWLLWQKPSIKSQATWELRQLKSQVPMGAGQREKQTEKQSANLPDFQGFPTQARAPGCGFPAAQKSSVREIQ